MAAIHDNLGYAYHHMGELQRSEQEYLRAIEITGTGRGSDHPMMAIHRLHLAELNRSQDRDDEALVQLDQALAIAEAKLGPGHYRVASVLELQAALWLDGGRVREAGTAITRAMAIVTEALDPEHRVAVKVRGTYESWKRATEPTAAGEHP